MKLLIQITILGVVLLRKGNAEENDRDLDILTLDSHVCVQNAALRLDKGFLKEESETTIVSFDQDPLHRMIKELEKVKEAVKKGDEEAESTADPWRKYNTSEEYVYGPVFIQNVTRNKASQVGIVCNELTWEGISYASSLGPAAVPVIATYQEFKAVIAMAKKLGLESVFLVGLTENWRSDVGLYSSASETLIIGVNSDYHPKTNITSKPAGKEADLAAPYLAQSATVANLTGERARLVPAQLGSEHPMICIKPGRYRDMSPMARDIYNKAKNDVISWCEKIITYLNNIIKITTVEGSGIHSSAKDTIGAIELIPKLHEIEAMTQRLGRTEYLAYRHKDNTITDQLRTFAGQLMSLMDDSLDVGPISLPKEVAYQILGKLNKRAAFAPLLRFEEILTGNKAEVRIFYGTKNSGRALYTITPFPSSDNLVFLDKHLVRVGKNQGYTTRREPNVHRCRAGSYGIDVCGIDLMPDANWACGGYLLGAHDRKEVCDTETLELPRLEEDTYCAKHPHRDSSGERNDVIISPESLEYWLNCYDNANGGVSNKKGYLRQGKNIMQSHESECGVQLTSGEILRAPNRVIIVGGLGDPIPVYPLVIIGVGTGFGLLCCWAFFHLCLKCCCCINARNRTRVYNFRQKPIPDNEGAWDCCTRACCLFWLRCGECFFSLPLATPAEGHEEPSKREIERLAERLVGASSRSGQPSPAGSVRSDKGDVEMGDLSEREPLRPSAPSQSVIIQSHAPPAHQGQLAIQQHPPNIPARIPQQIPQQQQPEPQLFRM